MEKAILLGSSAPNTLGVIESLALMGVKSYVVLLGHTTNPFVLSSKHVLKYWICDNEKAVLQCLENNFNEEKLVVYTCNDRAACLIDANYEKLKNKFYLPHAEYDGNINALVKKPEMIKLANEVGLSVPTTCITGSCMGGVM